MSTYSSWVFALALLPLAACNSNPSMQLASTVPTPQTLPSVSAQDQKFVNQAISSDIFEVKSAQLALQKSRSPRTRDYAQKILDEHTANDDKLRQLASTNGIQVPTDFGPEGQRAYAAIDNTRRIFDSEYFRQQALAHQTAITVYQDEINNGYNNDLKQYAQTTLPSLQEHLQMAQSGRALPMGQTPARPTYPAASR